MKDKVVIAGLIAIVVSMALSFVELYKVQGLPAHILLVHIPLVMVPLCVIAIIALVVKADWLARFGPLVMFATIFTSAMTIMAAGAGEQLRDHGVGGNAIHDHAEAADKLRIVVFVLSVLIFALVAWDRRRRHGNNKSSEISMGGLIAKFVVAGVAILSLASVIQTGHLGSKAVWQNRLPDGTVRQGQVTLFR